MKKELKINWVVTIFMISLHLATLIGLSLLLCLSSIPAKTWILTFTLWVLAGLSITAGYHRLFSHKAYRAHPAIRLLFALFGASNFQGSIIEWSIDHRNHHRYTDTEKDPYSIKKGFWHAHITWLFTLDESKRRHELVEDLYADPIVRLQHQFILPLMIIMTFAVPTLISCLWGDPLGGFIVAGGLRLLLNLHSTWAINSVCHLFGKGHYTEQSAKDNWITAFFTFGEGYHNFHHQFPIDFRNGIRWFDFDPTKWLIKSLSYIKLTSDLKTVKKQKILQYKIAYQQKQSAVDQPQDTVSIQSALQEIYKQLQAKIHKITLFEKKIIKLQQQLALHPTNKKIQKRIKLHKKAAKIKWKEIKKNVSICNQAVKLNQRILATNEF